MKLNYALFALLVLSSSTAAAQPGTEAGPPPPPGPAPAPAPPGNIDLGVIEDANSGRMFFAPTALTPPAGTFSFQDWWVLFAGVGYSPSDNVALSVSTLVPVVTDMPVVILGSAKVKLVDSGPLKVAGHASVLYLQESVSDSNDNFSTATLGGVATYCLDPDCHSMVNGYLAGGFALEDVDQSVVPFVASIGLVQRLSRRVKLVLEADTAFVLGEETDSADGFLGCAGVRFTSKNIGVDFGVVRPIPCDGCDQLIAVPMLNFTYRSL